MVSIASAKEAIHVAVDSISGSCAVNYVDLFRIFARESLSCVAFCVAGVQAANWIQKADAGAARKVCSACASPVRSRFLDVISACLIFCRFLIVSS